MSSFPEGFTGDAESKATLIGGSRFTWMPLFGWSSKWTAPGRPGVEALRDAENLTKVFAPSGLLPEIAAMGAKRRAKTKAAVLILSIIIYGLILTSPPQPFGPERAGGVSVRQQKKARSRERLRAGS